MITDLNLEIIDICNLRCTMCDIWKNQDPHYLWVDDVRNILSSQYLDTNVDITLTGGEPLLHPNIVDIIREIYQSGQSVATISTNGTMYSNLKKVLLHMKESEWSLPGVHISLDGSEQIHDSQRSVAWSFKKSLQTIILLRQEFPEVSVKIKFTVTPANIRDIWYIHKLSAKLGVKVLFKLVEDDTYYTNTKNSPHLLTNREKQKVSTILSHLLSLDDIYAMNLIQYIKTGKLPFSCSVPANSLFIMADGEIFPCTRFESIGNIRRDSIDTLLYNTKHTKLIDATNNYQCHRCFSPHGSYKSAQ